MRPAVITAVLLLVGIINTVTAQSAGHRLQICSVRNVKFCDFETKWISFDENRCLKLMTDKKTFNDAQAFCESFDSNLVSIHNDLEMRQVKCVSLYFPIDLPVSFWIGAERSGDGFKYTDGTEFKFTDWRLNEPNNYAGVEDCVEANFLYWGKWNDASCSLKKDFVCMKKK